ncbi:hypothetical protein [Streptomyces sp. SID337]|uniref:hypothetical protein n=1 Tax=Streptomyces sp. SID337 TaxID=2690262 RepID=UPI0019277B6A|nr:hypothetical protein [Streptomyces sp. SID337]
MTGHEGLGAAGGAGAVDAPRAPEGANGWDSRSEELLGAGAALPGEGVSVPVAVSVPAFGEERGENAGGDDGDSGWDARGKGRRGDRRPADRAGAGVHADAPECESAVSPSSPARAAARAEPPPRRGAADPVKALMHRHRELCERAVHPLEIAAGLEAHGVTDRAAARFRHRDVFALAEEMYARVPTLPDGHTPSTAEARATPSPHAEVPSGWALFALLPGAVCGAAVAGAAFSEGSVRLTVTVVGPLAVALALRVALRNGPLRATRPVRATRAWVCWLLAYALLGDGLLHGAVTGGPDGPGDLWAPATAALLGLALAVAPAIWCARLFAVRAGARLAASRGLDEFASSVRPLLSGVLALFLGALGALLAGAHALLGDAGAGAGAGRGHGTFALLGPFALGTLLLLARLLAVHGFIRAPVVLLGAAGTCEAAAPALAFAGRLPGLDALAVPVTAAVDAWGPGVVPTAACGAAALVLLVHAARTLALASAHAGHGAGRSSDDHSPAGPTPRALPVHHGNLPKEKHR